MADYFGVKNSWVGFKEQSAYSGNSVTDILTVGATSTWKYVPVGIPSVTVNQEVIDFERLSGQVGAKGKVQAGSQYGGTLTISGPIRSQSGSYDGSNPPVASPEFELLAAALGTSVAGLGIVSNEVDAGSTAEVVATKTASGTVGNAYAFGDTTSTVDSIGWLQSSGTMAFTMIEDMSAVPASNDELFGMKTACVSSAQPTPLAFRWAGSATEHDLVFVSCIPKSAKLTFAPRSVPTFEVTYVFNQIYHAQAGGLATDQIGYSRQNLPPLIGEKGGRTLISGSTAPDGTAKASTCGVTQIEVSIENELAVVDCPSGLQGVGDVVITGKEVMITADTVIDETDYGTRSIWDDRFDNQTEFSFSMQLGSVIGQLFAMLVPGAFLSSPPQWTQVGGSFVGQKLQMHAGEYNDDSLSSNAGNSAFRIAQG